MQKLILMLIFVFHCSQIQVDNANPRLYPDRWFDRHQSHAQAAITTKERRWSLLWSYRIQGHEIYGLLYRFVHQLSGIVYCTSCGWSPRVQNLTVSPLGPYLYRYQCCGRRVVARFLFLPCVYRERSIWYWTTWWWDTRRSIRYFTFQLLLF